jgi:hypothetical protein
LFRAFDAWRAGFVKRGRRPEEWFPEPTEKAPALVRPGLFGVYPSMAINSSD